jgi:hypothetical protein
MLLWADVDWIKDDIKHRRTYHLRLADLMTAMSSEAE